MKMGREWSYRAATRRIVPNNGSNPFVTHLGGFNAPTSGDYAFQARSDDGTAVWVDGQPVLDNNRSQGRVTDRNS
jgi:hypothetical protein